MLVSFRSAAQLGLQLIQWESTCNQESHPQETFTKQQFIIAALVLI